MNKWQTQTVILLTSKTSFQLTLDPEFFSSVPQMESGFRGLDPLLLDKLSFIIDEGD